MAENKLIEASAGTGKTQALANHLIDLLRHGVKPREIVALTFSRMAAGEIFERFVSLLAESAKTSPSDVRLLRDTIATQHLFQTGTLDGFLLKIVRSFPLELGLLGDLEMMGDFEKNAAVSRVSFSILRQTDSASKKAFLDAFTYAMRGRHVRAFVAGYRKFISDWHELFLSMRGQRAFGDPCAIWGSAPDFLKADANMLAYAADALVGLCDHKGWPDFVEGVRAFRGDFSSCKGLMKRFLEDDALFTGATIDITFNRKQLTFGGEKAAAVRNAFGLMFGYVIRRELELAKGVGSLMSAYEREYDAKIRRTGKLLFHDVPRLIAELPADVRMALEYRMDASIRAWALDEFQDTSREQWRALENLIDEAKQSAGEKSLFIVGDRKQAIYAWRNGDVRIFKREKACGAYALDELKKSYRSSQPVIDAINAIFVNGSMSSHFPAWECPEHLTAKDGMRGFVQRVDASGADKESFVEPIKNALMAVDPVRRGISAAILVRGNDFGELLASRLKDEGVEGVVWEGESAILDTPALAPFMDLVMLSDHPGDRQSYEHFKTTPLARAKYPNGVPDASDVSSEFALEFTTRGLVRAFRSLRALLPRDPEEAWSRFTEMRFADMLRAASEFELSMSPGTRRSDFMAYLQGKTKRNIAEPGKIRIMTIHRSKGLGFDYVIVPLYEHEGLLTGESGPLVGDGWVVPNIPSAVCRKVRPLSEAWQTRKDTKELEELCIYYVALTRAKRAMTLVLHPAAKSDSKTLRFSDIVRESMPEPEIGEGDWYADFDGPKETGAGSDCGLETEEHVFRRGPRRAIRRRLPSKLFHDGMSAGDLFVSNAGRMAALRRGTEVHAQMESVEWLDPSSASTDLERELVRPDGLVDLWREKGYELFVDGEWESGQIDRAVFTRDESGNLCAVVYDFKTNRMMRNETPEDFHQRMSRMYAGQLRSYARAVSALAGIPRGRIVTKLLLLSTDEVLTIK